MNAISKLLLIIFVAGALGGCAGEPQKAWFDATGHNRDENALVQDKSACNVERQQARFKASQMYSGGAGYCPTCGQLSPGSAMLEQQRIDLEADKVFTACMEAAGWRRRQ